MELPQNIANDNERIRESLGLRARLFQNGPRRHPVSFARNAGTGNHSARQTTPIRTLNTQPTTKQPHPKSLLEKKSSAIMALLLWISSFVLLFFASDLLVEPVLKVGSGVLASWTSLFLILTCRRQNLSGYRALALLGLLASLLATGYFLYTGFNLGGSAATFLCLGSLVSVLLGLGLREKSLLMSSLALTAIWIAFTLSDLGFSQLFWMFPALLSLQIYGAHSLRSGTSMLLASACFYGWLITSLFLLTYSGYIAATMSQAALVLIATLHVQVGNSLQDNQDFKAVTHSNFGWCAGIFGLLAFQASMLGSPLTTGTVLFAENVSITTGWLTWSAAMILTVTAIGVAGLYRAKKQKRHGLDAFILTILAGLLAFTAISPEPIYAALEAVSSAPNMLIALLIGGLISSLALAKAFNGARRSITAMILMGLFALGAEAVLISDYLFVQTENLMIFAYSALLMSLTLAGIAFRNNARKHERMSLSRG